MRILNTFILLVATSTLLPGCGGSTSESTTDPGMSQTAIQPVNANCPIMGGKVTSEGGTAIWNGQTIGFCCDGCSEKWAALTDEEKANALAGAGLESDPNTDDHVHDAGEQEHHAT